MKTLKEKYIKLASLFTLILFINYLRREPITTKEESALFNFIKQIKHQKPKEYFNELFDYVEKHKSKAVFMNFLQKAFNDILKVAKSQIELISSEINKLEKDEKDENYIYYEKYRKLLQGYFCPAGELDEMLDFFTKKEEFEKCEIIMTFKRKYYQKKSN